MFPIDKTDEWEARQDAKRQPSQTVSEPERVSDEDGHWRLLTVEEREQLWPKVIAELRTLRAEIATKELVIRANHTAYRFLEVQLANKEAALKLQIGANKAQDQRERDAAARVRMVHNCDWPDEAAERILELQDAIEKARRDALEEAALKLEGQGQPGYAAEIRALAAQKKEG